MRWLMKRESSVRRTAPSLHDDKSNATVLREFVEPETSPVYETLENGAALFDADAWNYEEWRLYKAFTPLDDVSAWTQVWSQFLPVLARIDSRLLLDLLRWPLRAVSALGPDSPFRQKVVEAFRIARTCCVSPDLEELRASVTSLLDDRCIQVIQAFAENYDLTNYDNELNHSQMRTVLAAQGADLSFGNVSTFKMGFDLGNHHKHAVTEPQAPRPRRGRPIKAKKKIKRKRLDAWNVFVSTHKPTCPRSQAGQCIKEGEHLRRLGRQWKELSAEMRRPYERMSVARQAAQSAHESSAEEDHAEQDPAPVRGPLTWPFCDESSPLRGPLLCKPEFTDDIGTKVDEWVQNIEAIVCHDPMALPTHATTYACHCTPGLCRQSKFDEATRMKNIFFRKKTSECCQLTLSLAKARATRAYFLHASWLLMPSINQRSSYSFCSNRFCQRSGRTCTQRKTFLGVSSLREWRATRVGSACTSSSTCTCLLMWRQKRHASQSTRWSVRI